MQTSGPNEGELTSLSHLSRELGTFIYVTRTIVLEQGWPYVVLGRTWGVTPEVAQQIRDRYGAIHAKHKRRYTPRRPLRHCSVKA